MDDPRPRPAGGAHAGTPRATRRSARRRRSRHRLRRDGTIYGTADRRRLDRLAEPRRALAQQRSRADLEGRLPAADRLAHRRLQVSPADSVRRLRERDSAHRDGSRRQSSASTCAAAAQCRCRSTRWLGVDGGGTAYGRRRDKDGAMRIVRCRRRADACESVPSGLPDTPGLNPCWSIRTRPACSWHSTACCNSPLGWVAEVSSDGGATWTRGAATCCNVRSAARRAHPVLPRSRRALGLARCGPQPGPTRPVPPASRSSSARSRRPSSAGLRRPLPITTDGRRACRTVEPAHLGAADHRPERRGPHVVMRGDDTRLSADGGRTWREIADPRFGFAALDLSAIAGVRPLHLRRRTGLDLDSADRGATWTRTERPDRDSRRPPDRLPRRSARRLRRPDDPHARRRRHLAGDPALRRQARHLDRARRSAARVRDRQSDVSESVDGGQTWASRRRRTGA